jgi:toxin ParE1/3/4
MPGKSHKIRYLSTAEQDITEIIDYIAKDNPDAALKLIDKINVSIRRLKNFPEIGVVPKDSRLKNLGYHILVVDNYLIFYVILKEYIEIRRILHGKRKFEFLL